jgi:hypothetical protein
MRISSTYKSGEPWEKIYPRLAIAEKGGSIILLTGPGKGVCIHPGLYHNNFGDYSDSWDEDRLKPFYGTVTIQSE